jgi:hypothetical protein
MHSLLTLKITGTGGVLLRVAWRRAAGAQMEAGRPLQRGKG